jgi:hypothetical protein
MFGGGAHLQICIAWFCSIDPRNRAHRKPPMEVAFPLLLKAGKYS